MLSVFENCKQRLNLIAEYCQGYMNRCYFGIKHSTYEI